MPLLKVDEYGNVYEQNSVTDDGRGPKKFASFADQGNVFYGALDSKEKKNRQVFEERQQIAKKLQAQQIVKIAKKKAELAKKSFAQEKKKAILQKVVKQKSNQMKSQVLAKAITSPLYESGRGTSRGNVFEGFGKAQTVSRNFKYFGDEYPQVDSHCDNMYLDAFLASENMGFSFNPAKIVKSAVSSVVSVASSAVKNVVAPVLKAVNPVTGALKLANKIPGLSNVIKEADRLTGGAITTVANITTMPARVLAGEKISKKELIDAAMAAIKVGSVVATGGSTTAIIGASASQLKQGSLGRTSLGKNLLSVGEIAGVSVASGATLANAGVTTVEKVATSKAQSVAEQQFEKATGIPVGYATNIINVATGEKSPATIPGDITKKVAETALAKAGLGNSVAQAILSNNAKSLGVDISEVPNLALSEAQRKIEAEKIKAQEKYTIDNLQKIAQQKADQAIGLTDKIKAIQDKLKQTEDEGIIKTLMAELEPLLKEVDSAQSIAAKAVYDLHLAEAQANLKVAAAEEGRLFTMAYKHPLYFIDHKIRGLA